MPRRINGANLLRIVDGANLLRPHTRTPPALARTCGAIARSARAYAAAAAGKLQPAHMRPWRRICADSNEAAEDPVVFCGAGEISEPTRRRNLPAGRGSSGLRIAQLTNASEEFWPCRTSEKRRRICETNTRFRPVAARSLVARGER